MRTIGLIGGMSWESTVVYYELINREVVNRLGGLHSAKVIVNSVDFAPIEELQREERWDEAGGLLADAAAALEAAGAAVVLIGANTMHRVAAQVERRVAIPLLHIADVTANAVLSGGVRRVGLLGTRFTMERDFIRQRYEQQGIEVSIPDEADREIVHRMIYDELCVGRLIDGSREELRRIAAGLIEAGAEGVVLGCTELPLLLKPEHVAVPLFDTTAIHAHSAVDFALAETDAERVGLGRRADSVDAIELVGFDHVYLTVSDFEISERFYDDVLGAFGMRKGDKTIRGEPHAHYFHPGLQLTIRPASSDARHDAYAPGLHHACLQARGRDDVDRAHRALTRIGVESTPPREYPEYNDDYYATFFADPDGLRLELVARSRYRREIVDRWGDLRTFVNPIAELREREGG